MSPGEASIGIAANYTIGLRVERIALQQHLLGIVRHTRERRQIRREAVDRTRPPVEPDDRYQIPVSRSGERKGFSTSRIELDEYGLRLQRPTPDEGDETLVEFADGLDQRPTTCLHIVPERSHVGG